jgi:hypothetical protein
MSDMGSIRSGDVGMKPSGSSTGAKDIDVEKTWNGRIA